MPKLTFYRQKRIDDSVRMGIELNGRTAFERFEESGKEPDPILLWYVDLRCQGPGLPNDPDVARDWLIAQVVPIRDGFARCSQDLQAGIDRHGGVIQWSDFHAMPGGVRMTIACSALRRVDARGIAKAVAETGRRWVKLLRSLEPYEYVYD
jgi:hypothetical protein